MIDLALISTAQEWHSLGCTILPVAPDGTKRPAVPWGDYQLVQPRWDLVKFLIEKTNSDGIGVVCGQSSNGLEMLEFEDRAVQLGMVDQLAAIFTQYGEQFLWAAIMGGYVERTPSGGIHIYYFVAGKAHGNTKLARDSDHHTLIETRGQGGFSVIAPSGGRTHSTGADWMIESGSPGNIPSITEEQRDLIYEFARQLDQGPQIPEIEWADSGSELGDRPGDDFEARATWEEILEPHGWIRARQWTDRYAAWTRPGKRSPGISATTGRNAGDRLYVFSTATEFTPEVPYSKFAAYAVLNFGGNFAAAASDLRLRGYGAAPDELLPPLVIGKRTVPKESTGDPDLDFWTQRAVLGAVYQWGMARLISPWTLLGSIMLRCLAIVPPWVTLPPTIGGRGSLNAFLAMVGPSGAGKSASTALSTEVLLTPEDNSILSIDPGSGEGIVRTYAYRQRGELVVERTQAIFTCSEIDMLQQLDKRQGSILTAVLRNSFTGEAIGQAYADPMKRIIMPAHSYRLGLSLGVQPRRAAEFIESADGGMPQRFWWTNAVYPWYPDENIDPPDSIILSPHHWQRDEELTIPEEAMIELQHIRRAQAKGELDPLNGQRAMAQIKAAYAFTILDDRQVMTLEDWEIAREFMAHSDRCRQGVIDEVKAMHAEESARRTAAHVLRDVTLDDVRTAKIERDVRDAILQRIPEPGDRIKRRDLQRSFSGNRAESFNKVLENMLKIGTVRVERSQRKVYIVRAPD